MTNKEKKVIFTLIAIMVVILIIVIIVKQVGGANNTNTSGMNETSETNITNEEKYTTELNDGTKLNTSENLQNVKKYNDLEISNFQVTSQNNSTIMLATVKNNSSTEHEAEIVKLTFLGENDEVLDVAYPVMPTIPAGGTEQFNYNISVDAANFKDVKIEADDR